MRVVVPLLCVVLAALAPAAVAAQPDDTSVSYRVNPRHTGEVPGSTMKPPLAVAWTRTDLGLTSYPIVAEGKVVVTLPSTTPTVVALDAKTGQTVWSRVLPEQVRSWSALAYEDGRVFVVDHDSRVYALDMDTGATLWSVDLWDWTTAPPTVVDGIVYIEASGDLFALRASDGTQVFLARMLAAGGNSSPAVDGDSVYLAYSCENAYRFDRLTGEQRWWHRTDCSGGGGETPVLAGDKVYIRHRNYEQVQALNKSDGTDSGEPLFVSYEIPSFAGAGRLALPDFVLTAGSWTFDGDGLLSGAPVIVNGVAYVGASSGRVYGVNPATGALVWKGFAGAQIPYFNSVYTKVWPGLAAGQGVLVVPTTKGVTAFAEAAALPPWEPIEPSPGEPVAAGGEPGAAAPPDAAPADAPLTRAPSASAPASPAAAPQLAPLSTTARGRAITVRTRLAAPTRVTLTISQRGRRLARVTKDAGAGAVTLRATVKARGRLTLTVRAGGFTRVSSITLRR